MTAALSSTAAETHSVDPYRGTYAFPLASVIRASNSDGKVTVPVSGSTYYAEFRHFTPVRAEPSEQGYSIAQLRLMDLLADSLTALRSQVHGSDLEHLIAASQSRATTGSAASVIHRLMAEYNSTLQTIAAATKDRAYAPIVPSDTGSALLLSMHV